MLCRRSHPETGYGMDNCGTHGMEACSSAAEHCHYMAGVGGSIPFRAYQRSATAGPMFLARATGAAVINVRGVLHFASQFAQRFACSLRYDLSMPTRRAARTLT